MQQLILELVDGSFVLHFEQKKHIARMFLRRGNKIFAWVAHNTRQSKGSRCFVLFDSKEAGEGGASFIVPDAYLLLAASDNE